MTDSGGEAWDVRLARSLRETERIYISWNEAQRTGQADPDEAQAKATEAAGYALLQLIAALGELPSFAGYAGLSPLHDLAAGVWHLTQGGQPDLLKPAATKRDASDSPSRAYIKHHAVAGVYLLVNSGMKQTKAAQTVARLFAEAGVRGRKKGLLSKTAVDDWCAQVEADPTERRQANALMVQAKEAGKAATAEQIIELLRDVLKAPLLRAKI